MNYRVCFIFFCCFLLLLFPTIMAEGALSSLHLWFFSLLPALLPFIILSNFILSGEVTAWMFQKSSYDKTKTLLVFVICAGFTFGLPIGAKLSCILLKEKHISLKQAQLLLNHCNSIGPAFLGGYVLTNCLHRPYWLIPTLCILYLPQMISLFLCLKKTNIQKIHKKEKIKISRLKKFIQILDISILQGFETIFLLGGYIILFGILCAFITRIPFLPPLCKAYVISVLEITNGIKEVSLLPIPVTIKYGITLPFLTFGGLCTLLQTYSIIKDTALSLSAYLWHKAIFAGITFLLSTILLLILY